MEDHPKQLTNLLSGHLWLSTMRFDGSTSIHEHLLEMSNMATKFNALEMGVTKSFLVLFILNSLLNGYGPFYMSYNTLKDE